MRRWTGERSTPYPCNMYCIYVYIYIWANQVEGLLNKQPHGETWMGTQISPYSSAEATKATLCSKDSLWQADLGFRNRVLGKAVTAYCLTSGLVGASCHPTWHLSAQFIGSDSWVSDSMPTWLYGLICSNCNREQKECCIKAALWTSNNNAALCSVSQPSDWWFRVRSFVNLCNSPLQKKKKKKTTGPILQFGWKCRCILLLCMSKIWFSKQRSSLLMFKH